MLNLYFFLFFIRSEQDKEPEQEAVSEAVASGPSDESAADSTLLKWRFLIHMNQYFLDKSLLAHQASKKYV